MRTSPSFSLYSTTACHLCEQAIRILSTLSPHPVDFIAIDISEEDALLERYGTRIPVLFHIPSGQELGWPFDKDDLEKFMHKLGEADWIDNQPTL